MVRKHYCLFLILLPLVVKVTAFPRMDHPFLTSGSGENGADAVSKIDGVGSDAEVVAVAALLNPHVTFLCRHLGLEPEDIMKVQRHRLLHLHLR